MRLLLDTHALLWWATDDPGLSRPAYAAIADEANAVLVSAVSAFELATKHRLGKLPEAGALLGDLQLYLDQQGFQGLALSLAAARLAGHLPGPHRDPFDRLLIAQSLLEGIPLVSNETPFDAYGIERLW